MGVDFCKTTGFPGPVKVSIKAEIGRSGLSMRVGSPDRMQGVYR